MKLRYGCTLLAILGFSTLAVLGQGGPRPGNPYLNGSLAKLFGDNTNWSATVVAQFPKPGAGAETVTVRSKMAYAGGKSRVSIDLAEMGGQLPAGAAEQMKALGMDKMIIIALPQQRISYVIYPGLQAYAQAPIVEADATNSTADYHLETTELGKESVEGHSCTKYKAVVTSPDGTKRESTIWEAGDLQNFPIKIQTTERGKALTLLFRDLSQALPNAAEFSLPAHLTQYPDVSAMMKAAVAKQMGGATSAPATGQ